MDHIDDSAVGNGPLKGAPPGGASLSVDVGATMADGLVVIYNTATESARIDRVTPIMNGDTAVYIGALILPPDRQYEVTPLFTSFPPRDRHAAGATEALGATIPPLDARTTRGYELILGFRTVAPGRTTRRGVTIDYTIGGNTFTETFPATLAICAPVDVDCETEDEWVGAS